MEKQINILVKPENGDIFDRWLSSMTKFYDWVARSAIVKTWPNSKGLSLISEHDNLDSIVIY